MKDGKKIKQISNLTYEQIADKLGLKTRQDAFYMVNKQKLTYKESLEIMKKLEFSKVQLAHFDLWYLKDNGLCAINTKEIKLK